MPLKNTIFALELHESELYVGQSGPVLKLGIALDLKSSLNSNLHSPLDVVEASGRSELLQIIFLVRVGVQDDDQLFQIGAQVLQFFPDSRLEIASPGSTTLTTNKYIIKSQQETLEPSGPRGAKW